MPSKISFYGVADKLSKQPTLWVPMGKEVPVCLENGTKVKAVFNGHTRKENIATWKEKGWQEADVQAIGYTEGKGYKANEYEVPLGRVLRCLVKEVNGKYICNVITRMSIEKELNVSDRFPQLITRRF